MLVLTRRVDEEIQIGDHVVVRVLSVEGGVVRLGIEAPKEVSIFRMEVLDQIRKENIEAASKDLQTINEAAQLFKKKLSGEKED